MILLRKGNAGPSVVVLQVMLNRVQGTALTVDGIFGSKTRNTVIAFQSANGLDTDGTVGKKTWPPLAARAGVKIVDVVDGTDNALVLGEAADIRAAGGEPILLYGMSNGVGQAVAAIRAAAADGTLAILRFHSHGAAGDMNVSAGTGGDSLADLSGISFDNLHLAGVELAKLKNTFTSYGCIEFHGCNVGQGIQGRQLLQGVANAADHPASAGINTQFGGGGGYASFRFEGPITSAYPGGISLKNWGAQHQIC